MTSLFQSLLIAHVLLGLLGILFFLCAFLCLFRTNVQKSRLFATLFGTASFWLAWIAGGIYYTKFYGQSVKPAIVAGATPWVHTVIMEFKEHLFLFLPFLSITALLVVWKCNSEIDSHAPLRKSAGLLFSIILLLGLIIAFSGILISSAGGR